MKHDNYLDNYRYKAVYKEDFLGLYALHFQNQKIIEKIPLILKGDDTRLRLTIRNRELVKLRNCYVSNEVKQLNSNEP
jgi:hypothetical protein